METITFYSYKGGVGRTLALANIAVYLSRFEQKVCIVDFDLEAPGVHYKLSEFFPGPVKEGVVDYIFEFTSTGKVPGKFKGLVMNAANLPENQGNIQLIPAGNVLSTGYWKKLAAINWNDLFYKEGGEGIPFFLELKEKIEKELKPDFLLIDSRTGVTEMSGVCTSILPDRVVFLIVNNRENIEGARQILRGIQKATRLKSQKVVEVNFALTRIPLPKDEAEASVEQSIIKGIKDFLDEHTENLEEQLNTEDISVLHSDRALELSESLRMNQEDIINKPLVSDYLNLFSKMIPAKIIEDKIDGVFERVISPKTIFEDPDSIQKELEALALIYPHPKSFEKLVDFYFLRNKNEDEKAELFCNLWKLSNNFSDRIYAKFIEFFLSKKYWYSIKNEILYIAEEYVKLNPEDWSEVKLQLAEAYEYKDEYNKALKHCLAVLEKADEKGKANVLTKALKLCIRTESYEKALKLIGKYSKDILDTRDWKIPALEVYYHKNKVDEITHLMNTDESIENFLMEENANLLSKLMKIRGHEDKFEQKLIDRLMEAINNRRPRDVLEIGRIFYRLGKYENFKNNIPDSFPDKNRILREFERRFVH